MVSLTVLLFLSLPMCLLAQHQYTITFQRSGSIVILMCHNESSGSDIDVERDSSVDFFVNRTDGVRIQDDQPSSLSELLSRMAGSLTRMGRAATFQMTSELEGYYSCGTRTTESLQRPLLVSLERSGLPTNMRTDYAVQSSDGPVTLLCPHEPGRLQGCYYGQWLKESIPVVTVAKPGPDLCEPAGMITTTDSTKYQLDRETFSLTITSVDAQVDSGNYSCELQVLDPAPPIATTRTLLEAQRIVISLTIDGEPTIVSGPDDVVIGAQNSTSLTSRAEFVCTARGRPAPEIAWSYKTISRSQPGALDPEESLVDSPKVISIDLLENMTEENGRTLVTSRLRLSISEIDGGVIRCKAGSAYKDSRLTILSKPRVNTIITRRGGPIRIDIMLQVHIQYPVRVQISYSKNDTHILSRRALQPFEPYNDTRIITLIEQREVLPEECSTICFVSVSLIATVRFSDVQGLSSNKAIVDDNENVCKNEEMIAVTWMQRNTGCEKGHENCEQMNANFRQMNNDVMAEKISCEQKKGEITKIAIAIGVVLLVVVPIAVIITCLVMCRYKRHPKSQDTESKVNNLTQQNETLNQTNSNLMQENQTLMQNNFELKEREKDLKQQLKDRDVIDGVNSIKDKAERKKDHFSDNEEIQRMLEEFVQMSNKVIEMVKSKPRVEADSEVDDRRVEHIKQVMESINRQLREIV